MGHCCDRRTLAGIDWVSFVFIRSNLKKRFSGELIFQLNKVYNMNFVVSSTLEVYGTVVKVKVSWGTLTRAIHNGTFSFDVFFIIPVVPFLLHISLQSVVQFGFSTITNKGGNCRVEAVEAEQQTRERESRNAIGS